MGETDQRLPRQGPLQRYSMPDVFHVEHLTRPPPGNAGPWWFHVEHVTPRHPRARVVRGSTWNTPAAPAVAAHPARSLTPPLPLRRCRRALAVCSTWNTPGNERNTAGTRRRAAGGSAPPRTARPRRAPDVSGGAGFEFPSRVRHRRGRTARGVPLATDRRRTPAARSPAAALRSSAAPIPTVRSSSAVRSCAP